MKNDLVKRIATVEIPVSNLKSSIEWYGNMLGMKCLVELEKAAMLSFNESKGVPTVYLVETADTNSVSFTNTNNGVVHSIIDFFTPNLEGFYNFLIDNGVEVGPLNVGPEGLGGFGFQDRDGNWISACNVVHSGQE
ncbi:glyoxalase/bleomycin resistance/dioxygenase family protein [Lottiidibacillus patelloidae]|uniref:Glyoxalase/bleomycin resistance/dioxygenase family protein n=2 Tax=Lottiidibacillus patelloidae TaxID=2670334 RepID=A0A263BRL3_9BACI|nr:glyoxalase/bleomycin resistance/dioxygenase family protein [Lottiidibacillus patelloidae]